ncbi:MAG: hypothetical protein ACXWC3_26460 [Burkholderiales bacterium]
MIKTTTVVLMLSASLWGCVSHRTAVVRVGPPAPRAVIVEEHVYPTPQPVYVEQHVYPAPQPVFVEQVRPAAPIVVVERPAPRMVIVEKKVVYKEKPHKDKDKRKHKHDD